ncbi:uncharacterized protein LOC111990365 [Quercus suber]|uniref:uncharacterized protein LOC111990365 n=1 Tax=Quercus suber TaxID=58331 RepID=UPI000CE16521|nr:uncharacterized protein LOC111990365 [Quercus suber]
MDRPSLKVQLVSNHIIHIDPLENKGKPVSITFVYGHPKLARKEEVWQQLSSLKASSHVSWLCIGDFNQILSWVDKFSFTQGSISGAFLFQKVISDLLFCDLAASGQQYTWMNNREDNEFIMERLDQAFATVEWINMYPWSRAAQLWAKFLSVRKSARNWNKFVFGKVDYEIKLKQAQLQQIQNSIGSVEDIRKERLLRGELEELLDREEMM